RPAYGLLVETGLASERRIHEQIDLSAFYEIDNMRPSLSYLADKLRRYEMRAQELLGSGRGNDSEPKILKVPGNRNYAGVVVVVYAYENRSVARQVNAGGHLRLGKSAAKTVGYTHYFAGGLHLRAQDQIDSGKLVKRENRRFHKAVADSQFFRQTQVSKF